jgi:hypothetical protein
LVYSSAEARTGKAVRYATVAEPVTLRNTHHEIQKACTRAEISIDPYLLIIARYDMQHVLEEAL